MPRFLDPSAAQMPAGHVAVLCRRAFAVLPDGSLSRNDHGEIINLGHPSQDGARILPGERCAVRGGADVDILVKGGFAELVVP